MMAYRDEDDGWMEDYSEASSSSSWMESSASSAGGFQWNVRIDLGLDENMEYDVPELPEGYDISENMLTFSHVGTNVVLDLSEACGLIGRPYV